jgi:hypothetical protein
VSGISIINSTVGEASSTTQSSDWAIGNGTLTANAVATNDYIYNCGECVHGAWTLNSSYVNANAVISGEHQEDWYFSDQTISANNDVLLNPFNQTATLFGDTQYGGGGPADNHIKLTNSLLAG